MSGCDFQRVRPAWGALRSGGTLDNPTDIAPDVHIYTRSKVDSVALPEGTPAFEEYYDHNKLWPPESLRRFDAVLARP